MHSIVTLLRNVGLGRVEAQLRDRRASGVLDIPGWGEGDRISAPISRIRPVRGATTSLTLELWKQLCEISSWHTKRFLLPQLAGRWQCLLACPAAPGSLQIPHGRPIEEGIASWQRSFLRRAKGEDRRGVRA